MKNITATKKQQQFSSRIETPKHTKDKYKVTGKARKHANVREWRTVDRLPMTDDLDTSKADFGAANKHRKLQ
jgi:hypothetical protein